MSGNTCHRCSVWPAVLLLLIGALLSGCQPDGGSQPGAVEAQSVTPVPAAERPPETGAGGSETFIGLYRYMADAAIFRDCADGRSYSVLIEADHLPLERAYLDLREEPGAEVLAMFDAQRVMRAPEPGLPEREHLRVTRFQALRPGEVCPDGSN